MKSDFHKTNKTYPVYRTESSVKNKFKKSEKWYKLQQ